MGLQVHLKSWKGGYVRRTSKPTLNVECRKRKGTTKKETGLSSKGETRVEGVNSSKKKNGCASP